MEKFKNPEGTFKHFEMKGGTFAGWLKTLNEAELRASRSADVFQEMDSNDMNGTPMVPSLLDDLSHKIRRVIEEMEKFRLGAFP